MSRLATPRTDLPFGVSVGYQVRATHRLVQRNLQSRIEPHGVSLGMWYFLRALWERDGRTQSELSAETGTMEPTTLSAVATMEAAGLVRREPHGTDKRKLNVFLTEKGRAMERTLLPEALAVVQTAVRSLSQRQVDALLATLKLMQANLQADIEESTARPKRRQPKARPVRGSGQPPP